MVFQSLVTQGNCRAFSGYFYITILFVLLAGISACSGGGTGSEPSTERPVAFIEIEAAVSPIKEVDLGTGPINIDGSRSIAPLNQSLSYNWSFHYLPENSRATLQNTNGFFTSFTPDVAGVYNIELIVTSGSISSRAIATVLVFDENDTTDRIHNGFNARCINCHNSTDSSSGPKIGDHMASTNFCEACHNPLSYTTIFYVDHQEVFGNCSTCHDGVTAIGKSDQHVPTEEECSDCHHSTESFLILELDGTFDHTGVTSGCDGCHNGVLAIGKEAANPPHMPTESGCEICHSTDAFVPALGVDHDALTVDDICGDCHNGVTATGKDSAANHPDTTADCRNCHNTVDFAEFFVDHTSAEVTGQDCKNCHDNLTARGLTPNHIPYDQLTLDCDLCHKPGNFADLIFDDDPNAPNYNPDVYFDHTVMDTTNCSACHDGVITIGKDADHVQTTGQCSDCHGSTIFFTDNVVFNHVGIDPNNCASCHDGVGSTGKHLNHIPTNDDCSVCHTGTNQGDFANGTFDHAGITFGCAGCHSGTFTTTGNTILGKPQNDPNFPNGERHVPTQQDCYFCHNTTDWLTSGQALFAHTDIADNCTSCHDGNYVAMGALAKTPSPPLGTHPETLTDCNACHTTSDIAPNGVSFANFFIDHSGIVDNCGSAGCHDSSTPEGIYAATPPHAPTNGNDCEQCHIAGGSWATAVFDHSTIQPGTRCDSCHNGTNATGKQDAVNHVPTNEDCGICHNTTAFAGAAFDHTGITGNCVSCHNGAQATGKPNDHVPTNDDCVSCHNTSGFLPSTFDHQGIVDNCESCHNGVFATGKQDAVNHVQTNQDCGVCHNTTAFFPATFDHTGITNNCARSGCHGSGATGKHPDHLPTNLDCSNCHTTATFVGGTWDHSNTTDPCSTCHNGTTATGKGNNHFDTTVQCDACHVTTGWAPVDYNHQPGSNYPGDHRANLSCISCHTGNDQNINYPFNQYEGTCAACHANDFDAGEHNGGLNNNLNCGDSGCHRVTDRNWD